jgi:taurine dioxygenase
LFVNPLFTKRLKGLSRPESDALMRLLFDHLTAIEHTVRLNWEPGTIAIWDNRTTQHRPVNDFLPQIRVMHRVTVAGEVPE